MTKIWVNTLVYNEENFLWFAVMSVAKYVDKILLWDTGSTDKTPQVAKALVRKLGRKIEFREVGKVNVKEFTKIRQKMLDETDADWFIVLDGDEIWWEDSIKEVISVIQEKGQELDSIVVSFYNCLGDVYHYQDEAAGRYEIDERIGNITIRAINRKIPGLHLENPYGTEGYFDESGVEIQKRTNEKRLFIKAPFLHLTHLKRTSSSNPKYKHELGKQFEKDFKLPEALYFNKPGFIKSPFKKRSASFNIKSASLTLPRLLKRKIYG